MTNLYRELKSRHHCWQRSVWSKLCFSCSHVWIWELDLKKAVVHSLPTLQHNGRQHPRLLCPSLSPRICSNSCPLSSWWHPTVSSSVTPSTSSIRWPKYWSFRFSISPSSEYSGLISFQIDWFWPPCCPGDFQESSPAPQFESISSLQLKGPYSQSYGVSSS